MAILEMNVVNIVVARRVIATVTCGVADCSPVTMLATTVVPTVWNITQAAVTNGMHVDIDVDMDVNAVETEVPRVAAIAIIETAAAAKVATEGENWFIAVLAWLIPFANTLPRRVATTIAAIPPAEKASNPTPARTNEAANNAIPGAAIRAAPPIAAIAAVNFAVAMMPI